MIHLSDDGWNEPPTPPEPVPDNQLSMFATDEEVEQTLNAPVPPLIQEIETLTKALQNESTSSM